MAGRIAIIDGVRTPFCRAPGAFKDVDADDLGAYAVRELMARTAFPLSEVDHVIFGNVIQPPHLANIARILSVKGGLPVTVPAFTVNRNCASGLEAIVSAARKIRLKEADVIVVGGTESMSNTPILFSRSMRDFLLKLSKAKTGWEKAKHLAALRPSLFYPEMVSLTDPLCGLSMGQTAENLAREFHIHREQQELFA